tara:strand:- start:1336 stop:1770 length:435 start_codon:yes stop_codon:yes gene_type:complete
MIINIFKKPNKNLLKIFLVYLISNLYMISLAETEKILIKSCYDGDTCTSKYGEKIRLACIDTPEIKGEKSDAIKALLARDYLNNLISGKEIKIRRITYDRYGRTVGELYIDKINIQKHLVDLDFAKVYKKYAHQCKWSKKYLMN